MTTVTTAITNWAEHPIGKVARVGIAVFGLASALFVLLIATLNPDQAWTLVLLGVALAATSVRAALQPTLLRLTTLFAVMASILYLSQIV